MVAMRIHTLASGLHGTPALADRRTASSQGVLMEAMDAIQNTEVDFMLQTAKPKIGQRYELFPASKHPSEADFYINSNL